jgi:hypothetical protein
VKSPISMENEPFNTSKCRGKLQKMEVLYIHSSKSPGPFPRLLKKKNSKNGNSLIGPGGDPRSPAARGPMPGLVGLSPFLLIFFSCPPLFAQVVNSCWLAPTHARLVQTSSRNFKHP